MTYHQSMQYYTKEEGKERIICLLCRHACKLKEGQVGICGVNKNVNGELKTLVYGHPVALNVDPIEKKPLYHMLPGSKVLSFGTVGCNFKCSFCQNWNISQEHVVNENIEVSPEKMVDLAQQEGAKAIAYTYNEPTIFYPYAKDIGLIAKERGIKNIFVSNGFESPEMIEDMASWVDAANIDLKSWDDRYYKRELKGGLEEVKDTLRRLVKAGIWVEVTTLLIEGHNDSDKDLKEMAAFIANDLGTDVPWHLSAFYPNYKMNTHQATKVDTLLKAKQIGQEAGLQYIYLGNVAVNGTTRCPKCDTILVERSGYSTDVKNLKNGHCRACGHDVAGRW